MKKDERKILIICLIIWIIIFLISCKTTKQVNKTKSETKVESTESNTKTENKVVDTKLERVIDTNLEKIEVNSTIIYPRGTFTLTNGVFKGEADSVVTVVNSEEIDNSKESLNTFQTEVSKTVEESESESIQESELKTVDIDKKTEPFKFGWIVFVIVALAAIVAIRFLLKFWK